MKTKYTTKHEEYYTFNEQGNQGEGYDQYNRPVKSPSPDKKSANIIVSTKSPQVTQIKRYHHHTPEKQLNFLWRSQKESGKEKPFSINTPSKMERDQMLYQVQQKHIGETKGTSEARYLSSGVRNTKIEIIASSSPEDFQEKQRSSRIRQILRSESNQLDYLKLLKSKEETIKQLKDIISMIKRNNISGDDDDEQNTSELRQRVHQLTEESKTLRIENQHLLNIIQKFKKASGPSKEENIHKKIRQLQDILRQKELEYEDRCQHYQKAILHLKEEQNRAQSQNQSLLRLLKQKEDSLGNSAMSVHSKSSEKQKLSLVKIREQYSQNLKLMKQNFYRQIQQLQTTYHYQLQQLQRKIGDLQSRLVNVQQSRNNLLRRLPDYEQKLNVREEYHRQKVRHQEIQNLMLEKTSIYEKELVDQKKNNQRLINELSKIAKTNEQLQSKSQLYLQELSQIRSKRQDDQIEQILSERNSLSDENSLLKHQNSRLRAQYQELNVRKNTKISELEDKIQTLVSEYERHIIQENAKAQRQSNKLKQFYEKDKLDTQQKVTMAIDIFNKQNQQYKKTILQKNSQIHYLQQRLQKVNLEHSRCSQNAVTEQELTKIQFECSEFKKRCANAQHEIQKMSSELIQMDVNLREKNEYALRLEHDIASLLEEKDNINKSFAAAQINNDQLAIRISRKERQAVDLQARIKDLEKEIQDRQQFYTSQLSDIKKQNSELQQRNTILSLKLNQKQAQTRNQNVEINHLNLALAESQRRQKEYVAYNQFDYMQQELNQLKKVVQEYLLSNKAKSENQIVEEFYKLNFNYEIKLEENVKLMKEIEQLKTENANKTREKFILEEKVAMLENNVGIYERQLKQKRSLYEQLLQEKARIEKEVLLSKKIKIQQNQRQSYYRSNVSQITQRIDHLLELQSKRSQNMKGLFIIRQAST